MPFRGYGAPVDPPAPGTPAERVVVTDVDMPFGSMVVFMIKWALAAVPAVIILAVIWAMVAGVGAGIIASMR